MASYFVQGGTRLIGTVKISGAKNSAVAILPAALCADNGAFKISNVPSINDIESLKKIMKNLGVKISDIDENSVYIDSNSITSYSACFEATRKMRASYYFLGALLSRFGKAEVFLPGGCPIGVRPIDQHIKGFLSMGATSKIEHGKIILEAENGLIGANIYLDVASVGATINLMIAASKAKGDTKINNAAKEPHIVDVANFLNKMGAKIQGAGTDTICITGVSKLNACDYSIVPDQIEAGTYMIAAVATQGDVTITNIIPNHLDFLTSKLKDCGASIEYTENSIRIYANHKINPIDIKTMPYPGFPTDLQQPMAALLALSTGKSIVTESVWENRFKYMDELKKMGAVVKVEGNVAIIEGVKLLTGADVLATDLRGGAALVIAGLCAEGNTIIEGIEHIERGYENIDLKLSKLGACIKKIN